MKRGLLFLILLINTLSVYSRSYNESFAISEFTYMFGGGEYEKYFAYRMGIAPVCEDHFELNFLLGFGCGQYTYYKTQPYHYLGDVFYDSGFNEDKSFFRVWDLSSGFKWKILDAHATPYLSGRVGYGFDPKFWEKEDVKCDYLNGFFEEVGLGMQSDAVYLEIGLSWRPCEVIYQYANNPIYDSKKLINLLFVFKFAFLFDR